MKTTHLSKSIKGKILLFANVLFFAMFISNAKAQRLPSFRDEVFKNIPLNIREEICKNVNWIMALDYAGDVKKMGNPVIIIGPYGQTYNAVRGLTGGRSCGHIAALYANAGYRDAALSWLLTAQSHNPHVQNLFNTYPEYTLAYASHDVFLKQAIEGIPNLNPDAQYGRTLLAYLERVFKL